MKTRRPGYSSYPQSTKMRHRNAVAFLIIPLGVILLIAVLLHLTRGESSPNGPRAQAEDQPTDTVSSTSKERHLLIQVLDAQGRKPLSGVSLQVNLMGVPPVIGTTDRKGGFDLKFPEAGLDSILAEKPGYMPKRTKMDSAPSSTVQLLLTPIKRVGHSKRLCTAKRDDFTGSGSGLQARVRGRNGRGRD